MVLKQTAPKQDEKSQLLDDMAKAIVEAIAPDKIILFGSQARGTANIHSDYDFLIIDPTPFGKEHSRRKTAVKVWRALRPFAIAADVLMYNAEEVEYWSQSLNNVVSCALREGKVLYERPASS